MIEQISAEAIAPALGLLPAKMASPAAEVLLLAIGLQESRLTHRRQINGAARGLWQFERSGIRGVLKHKASRPYALALCKAREVEASVDAVYAALEHDDVLAAGIARLLLWTDPEPLPALGEFGAAWDYYLRTWRPGKPHRHTWDALYGHAMDAVREAA
jgi:hypothetical protein